MKSVADNCADVRLDLREGIGTDGEKVSEALRMQILENGSGLIDVLAVRSCAVRIEKNRGLTNARSDILKPSLCIRLDLLDSSLVKPYMTPGVASEVPASLLELLDDRLDSLDLGGSVVNVIIGSSAGVLICIISEYSRVARK